MAKNDPPAPLIAYIEEISAALQGVGLTASVFDPDSYLQLHYTEAELATLLGPFQNVDSSLLLLRILQIGILHGYFDTIHGASAAQFYAFLEFLRTPSGRDALALISQRDRLSQSGGKRFTAQDMDWIAKFEVQRDDFAARQNDCRRDHEAIINELERQLRETHYQVEANLAQTRDGFSPAGLYTPLSGSQFKSSCWNEYILECGRQNLLPVEQSDAYVREIEMNIGDKINKRHVLDYLNIGNHKQQLLDYINSKIADLDDQKNVRAAAHLRRLVTLVCPQPTAPPPSEGRGEPGGEGTDGPAADSNPEDLFNQVIVGATTGDINAEAPTGVQAQTNSEQGTGVQVVPPPTFARANPTTRSGRGGGGRPPRRSHRLKANTQQGTGVHAFPTRTVARTGPTTGSGRRGVGRPPFHSRR